MREIGEQRKQEYEAALARFSEAGATADVSKPGTWAAALAAGEAVLDLATVIASEMSALATELAELEATAPPEVAALAATNRMVMEQALASYESAAAGLQPELEKIRAMVVELEQLSDPPPECVVVSDHPLDRGITYTDDLWNDVGEYGVCHCGQPCWEDVYDRGQADACHVELVNLADNHVRGNVTIAATPISYSRLASDDTTPRFSYRVTGQSSWIEGGCWYDVTAPGRLPARRPLPAALQHDHDPAQLWSHYMRLTETWYAQSSTHSRVSCHLTRGHLDDVGEYGVCHWPDWPTTTFAGTSPSPRRPFRIRGWHQTIRLPASATASRASRRGLRAGAGMT